MRLIARGCVARCTALHTRRCTDTFHGCQIPFYLTFIDFLLNYPRCPAWRVTPILPSLALSNSRRCHTCIQAVYRLERRHLISPIKKRTRGDSAKQGFKRATTMKKSCVQRFNGRRAHQCRVNKEGREREKRPVIIIKTMDLKRKDKFSKKGGRGTPCKRN